MENEVKLAAGAIVALAVATAALVVMPYMQVRDIKPPEGLKPYTSAELRGRQVYIRPGRLLLRQTPPAWQHAHRPRPVQHRRAPVQ